MDFIKKHYEKVILGIVLVGLVAALAFIPFKVANEKSELEQQRAGRIPTTVKELPKLDLESKVAAAKRLETPLLLDFTTINKVFNPMIWKQAADKHLIKDDSRNIGPGALVVTNQKPLYTTISFESVSVSDTSGAHYFIAVQKDAATTQSQRSKKSYFCVLNEKKDFFTLRKVEGPPDNPTKLTVELNDTGESAVLSKEQPFKRIDGYIAEFRYDPEKKIWPSRRVGDTLTFDGEQYKIVAITATEAVISAPNQKKWTVAINANTTP